MSLVLERIEKDPRNTARPFIFVEVFHRLAMSTFHSSLTRNESKLSLLGSLIVEVPRIELGSDDIDQGLLRAQPLLRDLGYLIPCGP